MSLCVIALILHPVALDFLSIADLFFLALSKEEENAAARLFAEGEGGGQSWELMSLLLFTADCLVCSVDACRALHCTEFSDRSHEMGQTL